MSSRPTFNAYLTSSPAVGWNYDELIKRAPEYFSGDLTRPLYIAASGRDFPDNLSGIRRFADIIEKQHPGEAFWRFDYFETEYHYSLVHLATHRSLKFLYTNWQVTDEVASGGISKTTNATTPNCPRDTATRSRFPCRP